MSFQRAEISEYRFQAQILRVNGLRFPIILRICPPGRVQLRTCVLTPSGQQAG